MSLANSPQVGSACEIGALADVNLAKIFKYLPPYDRLLTSEVCKRWLNVSRMGWLDITNLDLSPIPGPNIAAIVKRCPNLRTVFAKEKVFGLNQLKILSSIPLDSVTLLRCTAFIKKSKNEGGIISDPLSAVFSNNLVTAGWSELSLADFKITVQAAGDENDSLMGFPAALPVAVKRLQMSELTCSFERSKRAPFAEGLCFGRGHRYSDPPLLHGFEQRQQLECVILNGIGDGRYFGNHILLSFHGRSPIYDGIGSLQNLRELYLGAEWGFLPRLSPIFKLPKLEVLFLHDFCVSGEPSLAAFKKLTSLHPTLRILVLTGDLDEAIQLPVRRQYPNGLGSDPVPLLHIFMDTRVSAKISFASMPSAAAKVYSINEPLAQFLEREDIAPIFKGVWIAEKIKEAAKQSTDVPFMQPEAWLTSRLLLLEEEID